MQKASPNRFECYDTQVVLRSPAWAAAWCLLTVGVSGAVRHGRINGELARFGRARGRMPFAFIASAPARAVLAWVVGIIAWLLVVAAAVTYAGSVVDGSHTLATDDLTSAAGLGLLLVPLWLTARHTAQRIATASHLVGVVPDPRFPLRAAIATVLFPPAGTWSLQRAINRTWATWRRA
jgi:hypothetical protein